jgi:hypothetical protein
MYQRNDGPDAASVLATVARSIRDLNDRVDEYLEHMETNEVLNPFRPGAGADSTKMYEPVPRRFWESIGIRRIVSNTSPGGSQLQRSWDIEKDKYDRVACIRGRLKNEAIIEGLRTFISGCPLIGFANWASTDEASCSWEGVFSDVIKPLKKRDFEFIFQLGDTTKRPVFEVDDVLDIIGDYSCYGRVTLILDENEAGRLCSQLNGGDPDAAIFDRQLNILRDHCLFLFNTMSIGGLLILYTNRAELITRDRQFEFAGRASKNEPLSVYSKDRFNTGYQLGLLLHFDIPHCIALGLALSGTYIQHASRPDSTALLTYLDDWGAELRL